jgi:hypothetical protein
MQNSTGSRRRCVGLTVDSHHILVQCPVTFVPARSSMQYHSPKCQAWTRERRRHEQALGEVYVKNRNTLQYGPKSCQKGWTIRDGIIVRCAEPFTPRGPLKEYHSLRCSSRTLAWRRFGYSLGDSVRRTCAYRKCQSGEGGTRKTVDRPHRNRSGNYFCCPSHKVTESNARRADILAEAKRMAVELKILTKTRALKTELQKTIATALLIDPSSRPEKVKRLVLNITGQPVSTSTVERVAKDVGLSRKKGRPRRKL